ncbi:J domain-containing protein [Clostridium tyrobutyricum]|uniref:J domain-containing protein n=1 Tax=Clostridium tyrobutyricum TaxID=1519 RepID=UPI001C38611B|nr:J domain-containing protein [Clostridium tyrobutyricum]MBV4422873.1 tetratricopeptide repeat protein [Clostridium tyrobutyricum]
MSFWDILGIEPTEDKSAIKEAYASQLNLHHPEDDPEGFQALREAYETALKYDPDNQDIPSNDNIDIIQNSPIKQWISKVNIVYNDFFQRIDGNKWYDLLNEDICFQIDTSEEISYELLNFLMVNYYLPHKIWQILDEHFLWSDKAEQLYHIFHPDFINFVLDSIKKPTTFRYNLFKNGLNINYDKYIANYYNAVRHLNANNIYDARKSIDSAAKMYPCHPDLKILDGRYYLTTNNLSKAIKIFSKVIESHEDDFDAHLNRGIALLRLGKLHESYKDYSKAVKILPNSTSAAYGLAYCCFCMGKFGQSRELFHDLLEKYPYNSDIKAMFISSNDYLIDEYKNKPDCHYKLAQCYFYAEEFEKCHELLKDIMKDPKADSKIYLLLGNTLKILNSFKKAEMYINESIKLNPENWEAYYSKALLFEKMNKYKEALNLYNRAEIINNTSPVLYDNKGNLLCKLEKFEDAVESYGKSIELNSNIPHVYIHRISALVELGLYDQALDNCDIGLKAFPYYPDLYIKKSKILFDLKKYEDTINTCDSALKINIEHSKIYYYKGMSSLMLDNTDAAIKMYCKAIEMDPGNAKYCYHLACLYYDENNYELAFEYYGKALDIEPEYIECYDDRGVLYKKLGDLERAKQDFEKILEIDPKYISAYNNLGTIYGMLKDFRTSIDYYNKSLELDPDNPEVYTSRGFSYKCMKKYQNTLSDYKHAIELDPEYLLGYNNLGILYFDNLNDYDKSLEYFQMCIKISRDYHEAYNNIGLLYNKLKEYDKGISYITKALEIDPDNELYNLNIAILYQNNHDYLKAIEHYEKVMEISPDNQTVERALKKLKKKSGKK